MTTHKTDDDEQTQEQTTPLTDARLVRALAVVRLLTIPGVMAPEASDAIQDVLAEVERLRAENAALAARNAALGDLAQWLAAEIPDWPTSVAQHEKARELLDGEAADASGVSE